MFYLRQRILKGEEEFEDTKEVIRIRKSKKHRQHNGQKKKDKTLHKKVKIEQQESH